MVHATALIAAGAELADDVEVGAFAIIEERVKLGSGVRVEPQAQVLAGSVIGAGTIIGRGAVIGGLPQDLSFDPGVESGVVIGEANILREHVTVHRATRAGGNTTVGNRNYLMVGVHLGHDARLGDENVLANAVLVAGHVEIGSRAIIGGGAVFHQFLRVGDLCMVQGNGSFSKDIPPFTMAMRTNRISGLNSVGLRRAGLTADQRRELRQLFDLIWRGGQNVSQAVAHAAGQSWGPFARELLDFVAAPTRKGVCALREERAE